MSLRKLFAIARGQNKRRPRKWAAISFSFFFGMFCSTVESLALESNQCPPYLKLKSDSVKFDSLEFKDAFTTVYKILKKNLRSHGILSPGRYAIPAPKFNGIYLWDSAFIADVWRPLDPEVSKDILRAVLRGQKSDGRIPLVVNFLGASERIQPPLLSWAAWRTYCATGDTQFILETFEKLLRFNFWIDDHRKTASGLYSWEHAYESGVDDSPRFGPGTQKDLINTKLLEAVDLSSYVVMDTQALENMAEILGEEALRKKLYEKRKKISELINQRLWDESSGTYFDWHLEKKDFHRIHTITSLLPLIAGVAQEKQRDRMRLAINNPKVFGTQIPFPSVAKNDSHFKKDFWRGPVWIHFAYLGVNSMRENDWPEWKDLSKRVFAGVYQTYKKEGSFYEFYDPDQAGLDDVWRKKGNFWKKIILGEKPVSRFVGWTGLVNNLVIERYAVPFPEL